MQSTSELTLLPAPRHLERSGQVLEINADRLILLAAPNPQGLRFAAGRFQAGLRRQSGGALLWEMVASAPAECVGLTLQVAPERVARPQGYDLTIAPDGLRVVGHDEAGVYYGVCTLVQILEQCGTALPCLHIADWPDFPARGVMLDVSRDKVPTLETLYKLVDMLAGWKVNQLQLYTEHTFAYRGHREVWADASPYTGQDILELDAFCRERHVELVPNQNSFGHMHRWLEHERYRPLAELPAGDPASPWGSAPYSLCPGDPGSLDLLCGLYDELLPHFSSGMFNVGLDETFDLGKGRSRDDCAARGSGRVYLDFLLKIYAQVKARGRSMQFWGDIILQHPELIPELPRDAIALEWGYEANHAFDAHGARFAAAGVPFYVCPGTSSWCSLTGRSANALANLLSAAENGLKHGACGYLNTDWGDHGHWQPLPVSFLGFAAGAAYSWALDANRALDVPAALSRYAFGDASGALGRVAYDLGNVYQALGYEAENGTPLFAVLHWPYEVVRRKASLLPPGAFERALDAIDRAVAPLDGAASKYTDAALLNGELALSAHLARHACRRGLLALENDPERAAALGRELDAGMAALIHDYRRIWLARNRPGGLADSAARLEKACWQLELAPA